MPNKTRNPSKKKPRAKQQPSKSSQYKYEPLRTPQSIRLLQLSRGERDDPLQCYLFEVQLDDQPEFEAVSYTWGDPADKSLLNCNGKTVSVPRNLVEGLRMMRRPDRLRILWADAVCINQKDLEERGSQVALMARIFSEASKVLAWIGNGDSDLIQRALDYVCWYLNRGDIPALAEYHQTLRDMGDSELRLASYYWEKEDIFRHSRESIAFEDPPDNKTLEALVHLYNRSYFERGWIVQEIVLPRLVEVLYGEACIDYLFIQEFASLQRDYKPPYFKETSWILISNIAEISLLRNTLHNGYDGWRFVDLLVATSNHEFSDPRDKFYGILGLQDVCCDFDLEHPLFKPNYTISVVECYKSTVETLVVDHCDLGILTLVKHGDLPVDNWPSWVPRLDEYQLEGLLNSNYYSWPTPGCLEVTATRQTIDGYDCMQIRGILVSKVGALRELPLLNSEYMQTLVKSLQDRCGERSVAWTMTRGYAISGLGMFPGDFPGEETQHMDAYRAFIHLGAAEAELQGESLSMILNADPYYRVICYRLEDFVLFETEDGQLGIGRESIQPGDQVVWFFGGRMPFILRPAGDKWRLVGVCFMYDLINGEPVSQMEYDARYMAEDFTIF